MKFQNLKPMGGGGLMKCTEKSCSNPTKPDRKRLEKLAKVMHKVPRGRTPKTDPVRRPELLFC